MKKGVGLFVFFIVFLSCFSIVLAAPVDKSVTVEFGNQNGACRADSNSSAWTDQNNIIINYTVKNGLVVGDCFLKDPATEEYLNESCCPSGWNVCSQYIGSEYIEGGRCVERIEVCTNIQGMTSGPCESASPEVAERTLGFKEQFFQYTSPLGGICYNYASARCVWEDTNLTDGKNEKTCIASLVNITGINDTVSGTCKEPETLGTCIYQYTNQEDNCDNENQSITIWYTALAKNISNGNFVDPTTVVGMGWCQNKSQDYACSASIQLPSFSLFNFFVSILGIGMVYFLFKKNFKETI